MANPADEPLIPSAEIVATAFAEQYYTILKQRPGELHRFYAQKSVLSRPEVDGTMSTVETLEAINEKILSLESHNCQYQIQILAIDSQFSLANGVIVLVTGILSGEGKMRKKFTQTFFLAPQEKGGYYVLNDIFKYVDEDSINNNKNDAADDTPKAPLPVVTEACVAADEPVPSQTTYVEVDDTNGNEVSIVLEDCVESDKNIVDEKSVVVEKAVDARQTLPPHATEAASSNSQKDAPKKSFASVVNALSVNKSPFIVRVPPPKPVEQTRAPAPVTPEVIPPKNNNSAVTVEKNNAPAVKSHAIFVANLPMNATVEELDKVFRQFGSIKRDGIQVRSNKQQGTCFGFVDFESADSMENAIKVSPIEFGSRRLSIEERRANNDRGKFPSGKAGYRNDNFRVRENYGRENYSGSGGGGGGRGNYGGARGYGRNDAEKRGELNRSRSGETQRAYQNGGKVVRQPAKAVATA